MTGNLGWRRFKTWCSRFWYWARISAPSACVVAQTDKKNALPFTGLVQAQQEPPPLGQNSGLCWFLPHPQPRAPCCSWSLALPRAAGDTACGSRASPLSRHPFCQGIPFVRASLLSPHLLCHGTSAPLPHAAPDKAKGNFPKGRAGSPLPGGEGREGPKIGMRCSHTCPLQPSSLGPARIPVLPGPPPARCHRPGTRPGDAEQKRGAEQHPGGQGGLLGQRGARTSSAWLIKAFLCPAVLPGPAARCQQPDG